MPRPARKNATPPPPPANAVVSSAARVVAGRRRNLPTGNGTAWQNEAWTMLDTVGELEFYREWYYNALSRCTLSVVEVVEEDGKEVEKPATDPAVLNALAVLFDGETGQGEMLGSMGGHMAIPGETWLCGLLEPPEDPSIDMWRVLSRDEVKQEGSSWVIDRGDGEPEKYAAEEVYLYRIWRPHPRKYVEAHSSVRSALPILRELVGLSKMQAASIDSRLAGAGLLLIPTEVTFSSPIAPNGDGTEADGLDPLLSALIEAMVTSLEDRGDASSLAPIVVRAPGEYLDKIKHLTFTTPLSEEAREGRQELIGRLATTIDCPPEVLTGMADVNHWTGWLLDENSIKMHIESTLSVITAGLTVGYLWPVLQGSAERLDPSLRRFRIKGHTDALRQRPNRSVEAQALHGTTVITDEALIRETGLEQSDLLDPTTPEFRRRVLMRLATTGAPEVVVGALAALGVDVGLPTAPAEGPTAPPTPPAVESPPETSRDLPQQDQAAALLAVAEVMAMRAVERGWNKAGRRGRDRRPVPAADLDAALAGAWDHVPRAAALTGVDPALLTATLDTYTRTLLTTGAEHNPTTLATALVSKVINRPPALES